MPHLLHSLATLVWPSHLWTSHIMTLVLLNVQNNNENNLSHQIEFMHISASIHQKLLKYVFGIRGTSRPSPRCMKSSIASLQLSQVINDE